MERRGSGGGRNSERFVGRWTVSEAKREGGKGGMGGRDQRDGAEATRVQDFDSAANNGIY